MRPCRIRLSRAALQHNFDLIRARVPSSRIWAVIKANAYGHGLLFAADALSERADGFAVASLEEAEILRAHGFRHPILLLEGLFAQDEVASAQSLDVALVVHRTEQIDWLRPTAQHAWQLWLKLDTGMYRLGFDWRQAAATRDHIRKVLPHAQVHALSHPACADEVDDDHTALQLKRFQHATVGWPGMRSLANSAALIRYAETHFDWVRPGIALYGATDWLPAACPVMQFASTVIAVKNIAAGEGVGYGLSWRAPQDSLIAIVAAGYGDGYPRHAPSGTPVWVEGAVAPLAGRVSMDMLCIDLTHHPYGDQVRPGSSVELWGERVSVTEVATAAGTISYELLCGITERVHREEG